MNIYFAGAICEGWLCTAGVVIGLTFFYLFFAFLFGAPLYLLYKYISLSKHKHIKEAAAIRRRIGIVLLATVAIFIIGTIVNQVYLRVKG